MIFKNKIKRKKFKFKNKKKFKNLKIKFCVYKKKLYPKVFFIF